MYSALKPSNAHNSLLECAMQLKWFTLGINTEAAILSTLLSSLSWYVVRVVFAWVPFCSVVKLVLAERFERPERDMDDALVSFQPGQGVSYGLQGGETAMVGLGPDHVLTL